MFEVYNYVLIFTIKHNHDKVRGVEWEGGLRG